MSGRILLVDDHFAIRRGLRTLLSSRPEWEVCGEAEDGLDAIEKVRTLRPDVVVMDISMPRMNGLEASRIISKEHPNSKIVIISQNDLEIAHRQALEVDAAAFVAKTALSLELLPILDRLLGNEASPRTTGPRLASGTAMWSSGGGEMGRRIREHDWSQTPLGPIEHWPQTLKTSVNLIINSRHPMWIGWGAEATFLYNDAYIEVLSLAKHPWALGRPAAEVWAEIWDICGPLADKVFREGEATFADDVLLYMNRGDFLEETYYSFSYSPIHDETGKVAGLFCPSAEVTAKVINARRLRTLSELSALALIQKTEESACASVAAALDRNRDDIPFAVFYLIDAQKTQARLGLACGLASGLSDLSPETIDLSGGGGSGSLWPIAEAAKTGKSEVIRLEAVEKLPRGAAQQELSEAVVLPLTSRGEERPLGVLVLGVNPTRRLDVEYFTFYELLGGQITAAMQNARAAEEERKRLEALAEIDRAKTAFFSNVSHEFRTPLTLMLGPIEELLARSHTDLSPAAKSQLEMANRNGIRLFRLVNTLLDFSRIEAGRMQASYQATDLAAFTVELASTFRSATEKAGLQLELDCHKVEGQVFVDRGMWEKIVLNLISNAFKFTFTGTIAVALDQVGDRVELRVSDTGVGIPAQEIPRLFDRFHRIEKARSRTHEGSGIGLAMVQELTKLHGGSVRVESAVGEGSTFIVSLPIGSAHLPADRIGGSRTTASTSLFLGAAPFVEEALRWLPDAPDTADEILQGDEPVPVTGPPLPDADAEGPQLPRILIADDNADMRQYLVRLLRERYTVQAVPDGEAALAAARESRPDLILSDVMMPNLDGFGLLRELRSDPQTRTVPIVLLSARAGEESRVEGMEHGADDYLTKPFSARELLARVRTHLNMAQLRKAAEGTLRDQRERFELVAQAAQVGFWFCDLPFDKLIWDEKVKEHFWLPPDAEVTIDTFYERLHPDDRERTRQVIADSIANDTPYDIEYRTVAPDGREKWIRAMGRTFYDAVRQPYRFDGLTLDITERKRAEETNSLLAAIVASSDDAIVSKNLDGTITSWNKSAERMFGYTAEEAVGRRITLIVPSGRWEEEAEILARLRRGERIDHFHTVRRRKDGTTLDVSLCISPVMDSTGRIVGASKVARDITAQRQVERALQESEARLRLAQKTSHSGTWEYNFETGCLITSPELQDLYGVAGASASLDRQFWRDMVHAEDLQNLDKALEDAIQANGEFHGEFRIIRVDGAQRWLETTAQIIYDDGGNPTRIIGVSTDITRRKVVEERERQLTAEAIAANAKFRAVFEQTAVFAGIMSLDGILIDTNRLSLEACGYRAEEILGRPFWETGWWRGSAEVQAKIRAGTTQAAQGVPYREVLPYHWADGSERLVDFGLHPITDDRGQILFLHPTGVDITDLKRAEEDYRTLAETLNAEVRTRTYELEQRTVEVVRQSELLRQFSQRLLQAQDEERRRIARELHDSAGQLLTALGMSLSNIVQQGRGTDDRLASAAEQSQQLVQQLSQEIRTMSYLLHPPLLDEIGLADALHWYVEGLKERSTLEIELIVSQGFGRLSRELELVLFRLVQECLTNIHRHSGSKTASIFLARQRSKVVLEVQDRGRGIPPEKLLQIHSQGSGVGIRGMRERVRQFDGTMNIESNDRGTYISFSFPLVTAEAPIGGLAEDRTKSPDYAS